MTSRSIYSWRQRRCPSQAITRPIPARRCRVAATDACRWWLRPSLDCRWWPPSRAASRITCLKLPHRRARTRQRPSRSRPSYLRRNRQHWQRSRRPHCKCSSRRRRPPPNHLRHRRSKGRRQSPLSRWLSRSRPNTFPDPGQSRLSRLSSRVEPQPAGRLSTRRSRLFPRRHQPPTRCSSPTPRPSVSPSRRPASTTPIAAEPRLQQPIFRPALLGHDVELTIVIAPANGGHMLPQSWLDSARPASVTSISPPTLW